MQRKVMALPRLAPLMALSFLLMACGGAAAPTPTPTAPAVVLEVPPNTMIIKDGRLHPKELSIKVGETVTFINKDDRVYSLRDGTYGIEFFRGGFGKDQEWQFTFKKDGNFEVGDFRFEELRGMIKVAP